MYGLPRSLFSVLTGHSRMAFGSRNASIPYLPYSRPTPEYLNPPQGAWGSSVMVLITTRPARSWAEPVGQRHSGQPGGEGGVYDAHFPVWAKKPMLTVSAHSR